MSAAGAATGGPFADSRCAEPEVGGPSAGSDLALCVTVSEMIAEEVGAILMEVLGPFEEVRGEGSGPSGEAGSLSADEVTLVFYPQVSAAGAPVGQTEVLSLLPSELRARGTIRVQAFEAARDWVDGWKDHFRPILIGLVRIRPPWELALEDPPAGLVEVVINPGLGFGTGLHPTTRGTMGLLQSGTDNRGRLLDAGTGSGVLAIAAALLGWAPIVAFDNDPVALTAARDNVDVNGVAEMVDLREAGVEELPPEWSCGATVLANMTLEPVLLLFERLAAVGSAGRPRRMVVSGILAGAQERELLRAALAADFFPGRRLYEAEWVSLELLPVDSPVESPVDAGVQVEPRQRRDPLCEG